MIERIKWSWNTRKIYSLEEALLMDLDQTPSQKFVQEVACVVVSEDRFYRGLNMTVNKDLTVRQVRLQMGLSKFLAG